MRSGKHKIHEEIIWGVWMGLGLENVCVSMGWQSCECSMMHMGVIRFGIDSVTITQDWARVWLANVTRVLWDITTSDIQNKRFEHEAGSKPLIMCPVTELPVRDHAFVMHAPSLLHNWIRECFNQCEPVGICLAKFESLRLSSKERAALSRNVLPTPEPYVIHLYFTWNWVSSYLVSQL